MKNASSVALYTFWSGKQLFAVPANTVKEVKDHTEITKPTPVFHASRSVAGYINIRGEIHLALDFRVMTGAHGVDDAPKDMIIFKEDIGPAFGILVDRTCEIINVDPETIEPWNSNAEGNDCFNAAICKNGETLLSVIDSSRLLRGRKEIIIPFGG